MTGELSVLQGWPGLLPVVCEDEVRHHIVTQSLALEQQSLRGPAVLQGGGREGVALQTDPAVLQVEWEVVELHGTGGGHTQPYFVTYPSTEIYLKQYLVILLCHDTFLYE